MVINETYKRKLVSLEQAAAQIKDNYVIFNNACAAEASSLFTAIAQFAKDNNIRNVTVHQFLSLNSNVLLDNEYTDTLKFNNIVWFAGSQQRKVIQEGRATHMVNHFSEVPRLIRDSIDLDLFIANVSPMDKDGYFSMGTCSAYVRAAMEKSRYIILEVNEHQPRVAGDSGIHISEVDYLVELNTRLPEIPPPKMTEEDKIIGQIVASLIEDESTLQIGIGAMPSAVAMNLSGKRNLGVHTEMFAECMVDLFNEGVITGSKKSIHQRKMVGCFALGTKKLYEFMNNSSIVETYPVDYTNNVFNIAKNQKQISINSALEVDLTGQVCSESLGHYHYSGTGGQVDFARGAYMSPGGKSFLCMHSTAKERKISKVVPLMSQGAIVTTPRTDVDYLVTEYGAARLKGKTLGQRAKEIIGLAAPEFRKELFSEARKLKFI